MDALIRETREESGFDVEPVSVLGVFGGPDGFRRTYSNGDQVECLDILFQCRIIGGVAESTDQEVIQASFQPPKQLHDWLYPVPAASLCEAADNRCTLAKMEGRTLLL